MSQFDFSDAVNPFDQSPGAMGGEGESFDFSDAVNPFEAAAPVSSEPKQGRLSNAGNAFVRGAGNVLSSIPKAIGEGAVAIANKFGDDPTWGNPEGVTPEETTAYMIGQSVDDWVNKSFPTNPEYEDEFWATKLPEGLGSTVGFAAGGAAGAAAKIPTLATVATMGAAAGGVGGADDYKNTMAEQGKELDPEMRAEAFKYNGMLGTAEAWPIEKLFKRLDQVTGGSVKEIIAQGIKGGSEELAQEVIQQIGGNYIANDVLAYDPDRGLFEGAAESAEVGFSVGFLLNTLAASVGGRRRGRNAGEPTAEELAADAEADTAANAEVDDFINGEYAVDQPGTEQGVPAGGAPVYEAPVVNETNDILNAVQQDDLPLAGDLSGPQDPVAASQRIADIRNELGELAREKSRLISSGADRVAKDQNREASVALRQEQARLLADERIWQEKAAAEQQAAAAEPVPEANENFDFSDAIPPAADAAPQAVQPEDTIPFDAVGAGANVTAKPQEPVESPVPATPDVIVKRDGSPYANEKTARFAAKNKKLTDFEVVPVEGGFGLRAGAAVATEVAAPVDALPAVVGDSKEVSAVNPEPEQEIVDDGDVFERIRADVAGESPERSSLIAIQDVLEDLTDTMNGEDLGPEGNDLAFGLFSEIETALDSGVAEDISAANRAAVMALDEILKVGSIDGTQDALSELRTMAQRVVGNEQVTAPSAKEIEAAANQAATSATNALPEPTDGQKEAGNYKKGAPFTLHGHKIVIENPKASERKGTDEDGSAWSNTMGAHYGDIKGTVGADGDSIDVFVGEQPASDKVWIIDQVTGKDRSFDEHKVMMGFDSQAAAEKAYRDSYDADWNGIGTMSELSLDQFNDWIAKGDHQKPFATIAKKAEPAPKPKKKLTKKTAAVDGVKNKYGIEAGQTITPSGDVGYSKAGESYTVDSVDSSGTVHVTNPKTGSGTSWSRSELLSASRRGVEFAQAEVKAAVPKEPAADKPEYGASNTLVSKDRAAELREKLKAKLGRLNAGIDPEMLAIGTELAVFHIEAGARKFTDLATAMMSDLGAELSQVKPYLRSWYNGARDMMEDSGLGVDGMDDADAVRSALKNLTDRAPLAENADPLAETGLLGDNGGQDPTNASPKPDNGGDTDGRQNTKKPDTASTDEVQGGRRNTEQAPAQADIEDLAGQQPDNDAGAENAGNSGAGGGSVSVSDVRRDAKPDRKRDAADGRKGAGGDRSPDAGAGGTGGRTGSRVQVASADLPTNFHIENPLDIVGGGAVARFNKNQTAIETLHSIRDTGRIPSDADKAALAGYTGWGSFGQELFKGSWTNPQPKDGWQKRDAWLREHLGQAEWESAQRSIINAHYTDPPTVMAMWQMIERMGFAGGRVLEPSMGIGNFFGMMPLPLKDRSQLAGIELDELTGGMAKMLYPAANISIKGYQDSKTQDGFYDLIVGNWPFYEKGPADRRYRKINPTLHDYFFLKAIDQVRAGGLVVGITSKGTMDKVGTTARREMAKKAELVAAFRLPTGAFKEYAGTAVVTDIIILKKREQTAGIITDDWVDVVDYTTPSGEVVKLNKYYQSNPANVLGTIDFGHGTTTMRPGMIVNRPANMQAALDSAAEAVPADIFKKAGTTKHISYVTNNTADREGSITKTKDGLFLVRGEYLAPLADIKKYAVKNVKSTADRESQLGTLIEMRNQYGTLIAAERSGEATTKHRKALKQSYNKFTKAHGQLNDSWGLKYMQQVGDPFYPSLAALETVTRTSKGNTVKPSRILTESTIRQRPAIENPSVSDAFIMARSTSVRPTLDEIAELAKKPKGEVKRELLKSGAAFELPGGDVIPSDLYLAGNVRVKLREAQAAVKTGEPLERNVKALQAVVPKDVPYHDIEAQMGATWISPAYYADYVAHMLNLPSSEEIDVRFSAGRWRVRFPGTYKNLLESTSGFGTQHVSFKRLVNAAITNQSITVRKRDSNGNTYVDVEATSEVNEKISTMRENFGEWVWSEPERRVDLEAEYNEARNSYATPNYDGAFMSMEGMALELGDQPFNLRSHQLNAIWRALVTRRSLNAHEVGTGKTFTMAGIAIESRRYGLAKKPLILAHNANSATVAAEIMMMYPSAKVLYIDNLAPKDIAVKLRQIANDDWDAVVLPHSQIDRLSLTRETLMGMAQQEIDEIEQEAREAAQEDSVELTDAMLDDPEELKKLRSATAKDLVKMRMRIVDSIEQQSQRSSREDAVSFEDLGIDMVLVDEAHEFKKPPIITQMRMKGLNTGTSNKSIALQFLTRYIRAQNGGGNVHTFTGTPVTNTMTEVYHQMRYIMEDEMADAMLDKWDGWFGAFASEVTDIEQNAAAEYEAVTRLAAFVNVPELRQMIGQYMDVVFSSDMPEMQPRRTASGKILKDGNLTEQEHAELLNGRTEKAKDRPYKKVINVSSDMTPPQVEAFNEIQRFAKSWRQMDGKAKREAMQQGRPESPIITEGLATKASFDVRLSDYSLAGKEGQTNDHPDSKASKVVDNVLEVYNSDKRATQAIFSEIGFSKRVVRKRSDGKGGKTSETKQVFSTVHDIVERLVQGGIPRGEIEVVTGSTSKPKRKQIAIDMNEGRTRVVLGSSKTLGVGVNMQRNLRAMHHMDAPWMPGDLEQRNGRGHRQGNQWNTVLEYRYITDRLDGRRWQVLAVKDRFIKAFLSSKGDQRSIEGEAAAEEQSDILESFSEAAGDPRILIREKLKKNIQKLQKRERLHTKGVASALSNVRGIDKFVKGEQAALAELESMAGPVGDAIKSNLGDKFTAVINGKQLTSRKDANAALAKIAKDRMRIGGDPIALGKMYGFDAIMSHPNLAEQPVVTLQVPVAGETVPLSGKQPSTTSIEAAMRGIERQVQSIKDDIENSALSRTRMVEVSNESFRQAKDLAQAEQALVDLEKDMAVNSVPPPNWLRSGAPVDTEVSWGDKPFVVTGHRWTNENWFVMGKDSAGEVAIPYNEAIDDQGVHLYEDREFVAPEVIEKTKEDSDSDNKEGDKDLELFENGGDYTYSDQQDGANNGQQPSTTARSRKARDNRNQGRVRARALGIRDRIEHQAADTLVGKSINNAQQLAELAQVHRNPQYEVSRFFFMKGNEVVHASSATARLPGVTPLIPKGEMRSVEQWLRDQMQSAGADGYWLLHNHPSGDPTPSEEDIDATRQLDSAVAGFRGHVIINSNKFASIASGGKYDVRKQFFGRDELLAASKPSAYLGNKIINPKSVARIGKSFQSEGWVTLVGVTGPAGVRAISDVRVKTFANKKMAMAALRRFARKTGSTDVFAYGEQSDLSASPVAELIAGGFLEDAVTENGQSYRGASDKPSTSPVNNELRSKRAPYDSDTEAEQKTIEELGIGKALEGHDIGRLHKIARDIKSKNWGHFLGAIPRRYLVDFAEKGMTAVKGYIRLAQQMDADINQLLSETAKEVDSWGKWARKNKKENRELMDFMHDATQAGVDADLQYKPLIFATSWGEELDVTDRPAVKEAYARMTRKVKEGAYDKVGKGRGNTEALQEIQNLKNRVKQEFNRREALPEFQRRWSEFTPEAKAIYRKTRDSYTKRREEQLDALRKRIDRSEAAGGEKTKLQELLRIQFESSSVEGPYFPLARFGEYWAAASNEDGQTVALSKFESLSERSDWVKQHQKMGFSVSKGRNSDSKNAAKKVDPGFVASVTDLVRGVRGEKIADEIWQLYLQTLPEMSVRKQNIHRKQTPGYSGDAIRAYAKQMFHGGHQLGKLRFSDRMEMELEALGVQAAQAEREDLAEPLYQEMLMRHEWAMNPTSSSLANNLTSLGFAWYLGATPAAALVNLSQTPMVALPVLAAKHGWRRSSAALLKNSGLILGFGGMEAKLSGDRLKAFKEFERTGVLDKTQAHDLAGVAERGEDYSNMKHQVMEKISFLFHKAEQWNREITAMAAYDLSRSSGKSHDQAVLYAEDAVLDSHFDYGNANRPRPMQNDTAKVVLLFKQHSLNMTYRLWRDFHDMFRAADPELKRQASVRFRGILGTTFIMAGVSGMPLLWLAEMIGNALGDDDDEPSDWLTDVRVNIAESWGPEWAEAIMKGPMDGLLGITVSSRVGLNNLWLREDSRGLEGREYWRHLLSETAGPIFKIGESAFEGAKRIGEGKVDRGIETMLPKAAKDIRKMFRYIDEGATNLKGDIILERDDLSIPELASQWLGFTPAQLTMAYEQNNAIKNREGAIKERRGDLLNRYAMAWRAKDEKGKKEALAAISRFNGKQSRHGIKKKDIVRSIKMRKRASNESLHGINVSKRYRYLADELDFSSNEGD